MAELTGERQEYYDDEKTALERKLEAISRLGSAQGFIIITLHPDGKGGFDVFYARQKMNQETTERLMHDASRKFHEFDEKEKEMKQMIADTAIARPEWLTDTVIDIAKTIFGHKQSNHAAPETASVDYLTNEARKAATLISFAVAKQLFDKFCK